MTLTTNTTCTNVGCERTDVRVYIRGMCCPEHTPAALYGRAEPPTPPPGTTIDDLREAAAVARAQEDERRTDERRSRRARGSRASATPAAAHGPSAASRPRTARGVALEQRVQALAAGAPRVERDDVKTRIEAEHTYAPTFARDTTRAAAARVLPKTGTQRRAVYDKILEAADGGFGGATDLELARGTGLGGNSVRPRRLELVEAGLVVDTGHRRTANGSEHIVWGPTPDPT